MSQNVTLYNLLISCPGDIKDEIELIESAVNEFNELYAEPLGITIKTRYWSKSSYAQSGRKPQELLNEQFVNKCDAAVAIFWTRFGTPTDEYSSGTEEEIKKMLEKKKQVFMYFSDKPLSPSQMTNPEYQKVLDFREKYKDCGLYFTYSTNDEFRRLFFAHLSMYFLSEKKIKDTTYEIVPQLKLMGIDKNGKLNDEFSIYPFILSTCISMSQYIDTIRSMCQEISEINVGKRIEVNDTIAKCFFRPVEIDEEERKLITIVAEQLKLELSNDFFDLGNLNEETVVLTAFNGPTLKGDPQEIKKYKKLKKLYEIIFNAMKWSPIENAFSNINCLRLAIQNCGNAIDEDVEITFQISKNALLAMNEFPTFKNDEKDYLLNDCNMYELFGISSTAEYTDYHQSTRNISSIHTPRPSKLPGYVPDYSDAYIDELNDVFCYSIYSKGDNYIVKLKVDYIKHNTTVAFPTILFVKSKIKEIPYKITSKNNPNIVENVINIQIE